MRPRNNILRSNRTTAWAVAFGGFLASGCATPALVVPYHAAEAALIAQLPPEELRERYSVQRITHNLSDGAASPAVAALASGEQVTPLPPTAEEAAPSPAAPSILQLPKDSVWSEFIAVEQKLVADAPAKPPENLRPLARSPHAIRLHTTTIVAALRTAAKAEVPAPVSPQPSAGNPPSLAPLQLAHSPPSIAAAPYQKLLPAVVVDPLEHHVPPGEFATAPPPPVREFAAASRPPAIPATPAVPPSPAVRPQPLVNLPRPRVPELGEFAPDSAPPAAPPVAHPASPPIAYTTAPPAPPNFVARFNPAPPPPRPTLSLPIPEVGEFAPDSVPPAAPRLAMQEIPSAPPQPARLSLPIPEVGEFAPDSPAQGSTFAPPPGLLLSPEPFTPPAPRQPPPPQLRLPSTRDLWGAKAPPTPADHPAPTPAESVVLRPLEQQGSQLRSLLVVEQATPKGQPTPAVPRTAESPTPAAPRVSGQPTPATRKSADSPTPAAPRVSGQPTPAAPKIAETPTPAEPPALFTPVEPKHFFAMTSRRRGADPLSFGDPRPSDLAPEPQPLVPAAPPVEEPPTAIQAAPPAKTPPPQPKPLNPVTPLAADPLAPSKQPPTGPPPAEPRLIPQGVSQTLPLRGLSQISLDIRPPTLTDDQGQPFPAPRDAATSVFAQAAPFERHEETQFMEPTRLAPGGLEFCYQPLYFEEVNAERYGHDYGPLQPVVSMGQFISRTQWLPYMVFANPARHCTYHAHWTLPGYRTAHKEYPGFPYSAGGAAAEVAYVAGMIMIIP